MFRRFLVLIVLASILFVLANTVAHASPAGQLNRIQLKPIKNTQAPASLPYTINKSNIECFPSNDFKF